MLDLNNTFWAKLDGGYRVPYNPAKALAAITSNKDAKDGWEELWKELHHQGDVGTASYATVPHLVSYAEKSNTDDWNSIAITATIELCRQEADNPDLPEWLKDDYFEALYKMVELGHSKARSGMSKDYLTSYFSLVASLSKEFKLAAAMFVLDHEIIEEII